MGFCKEKPNYSFLFHIITDAKETSKETLELSLKPGRKWSLHQMENPVIMCSLPDETSLSSSSQQM